MSQKNEFAFTDSVTDMAAQAEELEAAAKAQDDSMAYVHALKEPITYMGITYETLTFEWGALTGADYLAVENDLLRRGKTVVVPEFNSDFLCGMAVRACKERDPDGFRVLSTKVMSALPLRDFKKICQSARNFLLRAESLPVKTGYGSENNT